MAIAFQPARGPARLPSTPWPQLSRPYRLSPLDLQGCSYPTLVDGVFTRSSCIASTAVAATAALIAATYTVGRSSSSTARSPRADPWKHTRRSRGRDGVFAVADRPNDTVLSLDDTLKLSLEAGVHQLGGRVPDNLLWKGVKPPYTDVPTWTIEEDDATVGSGAIHYTRFRIGPLPPGRGRHLGNFLRRTLLRHNLFRTHAPVSVRVRYRHLDLDKHGSAVFGDAEAAKHEFFSVPGIQESMIDLVRNVSQMTVARAPAPALTCASTSSGGWLGEDKDSWTWSTRKFGPCTIKVGDLEMIDGATHFETPLILPEKAHHLCVLTDKVVIDMEVEAVCCSQAEWQSQAWGRYRTVRQANEWLEVSPVFSPVTKVSYMVTATEDGKEFVDMEMWTRQSARPQQLLRTAALAILGNLVSRSDGPDGPPASDDRDDDADADNNLFAPAAGSFFDDLFSDMPGKDAPPPPGESSPWDDLLGRNEVPADAMTPDDNAATATSDDDDDPLGDFL